MNYSISSLFVNYLNIYFKFRHVSACKSIFLIKKINKHFNSAFISFLSLKIESQYYLNSLSKSKINEKF